ncbi:restriction endonuclease subunit S [Ligilactobacillus ruminis]|uniref:restriction endonuclease subunit S n=1 Tax=Ligilactobacillus ruminis TaxID=1623 RepID=UPI003B991130
MEEVCSRVQGNDGRMDLPTLTISAANGWMNQEDRFSGNIAGKEQKNYTLLHKGELSYNHGNSKLAKYGTVFSLQSYKEALVPRVYHSFKAEKGSPDFIEYYFATKLPDRELGKLISSGARMDGLLNIGYNEFMGIQMLFPSVEEQKQISNYFRSLEHLITLHQQKITLLTKLKKAMLEKMFPKKGTVIPEFRFNGFANAWEQRKLGDIVERVTRKNQNIVSDLPLTISAQYGLIDQNEFFDKRVASKDVSGYYLIYNGEFAYNKSISNDAPWGAIKRLDRYENGVLSTLYIVFKIKNEEKTNSDFIATYYDTNIWHKDIKAIAAEGARNHGLLNITPADFFETKLKFPKNVLEQQKIGIYFGNIDHLITLHQRKLDMLKKLKSACLNEMFI